MGALSNIESAALPKLIAFDLDGTLVDSAPGIAYSVDQMLASLGRPPCGEANVRRYLGNGVERLVKRALTGEMQAEPPPELFRRALAQMLVMYERYNGYRSTVYPGVRELLPVLRRSGIRLCGITNKKRCFTEPLLAQLELDGFFEFWYCGDDLARKKPDPLPLAQAMARAGAPAARTWMVGDSSTDLKAARAAGVKMLAVSYGYNHGEDIRAAGPDWVVDSLDQICTILNLAA